MRYRYFGSKLVDNTIMPTDSLPPIDKERALVDYEDLQHIAELCRKPSVSQQEIRRVSASVRRLLVFKEINKSASAFGLRLRFRAPNTRPLVQACAQRGAKYFQATPISFRGMEMAFLHLAEGTRIPELAAFDPGHRVDWKLDAFLKQPVFFFEGQMAGRGDVIEYIANKAGGAHFDPRRLGAYQLLDHLRGVLSISMEGNGPLVTLHIDRVERPSKDFSPRKESIDPVFVELLATCRFISESPTVIDLQERLKADLGM